MHMCWVWHRMSLGQIRHVFYEIFVILVAFEKYIKMHFTGGIT